MLNPIGGLSRCWRRSYQPCPPSQSRTWSKRILSSVSLSENQWIACHFWMISTIAAANQNSVVIDRQRRSMKRSARASMLSLSGSARISVMRWLRSDSI